MKNSLLLTVLSSALYFATVQPLWPQETRGSVTGRVLDPQNAVVPGATVAAKNMATGVSLVTQTNAEGNYRLDFLIPGPYELSVSQSGFKTLQRGVDVRINDRLQIDFALEVGQVSDSVTITGEPPLLEAVDANLGQVIDNRRVNDLALAQGNPTMLLMFTPGYAPAASDAFKYQEPGYGMVPNNASFHGAPTGTATYTLDGVNNVADITRVYPNSLPPTEAIQEFKVSHTFDASVGQGSGTSVDISLKSGTNTLHGAAYGFYRSDALGANSFLNNRAGGEKTKTKFRRAGFGLNGPVFLPKLYNGKDRTFFAFSYEDTYEDSVELPGTLTVPTADHLRGDFSNLLVLGSQYQIYDPYTTTPTGDGFYRRTPFSGNIIPPSRINAVSKEVSDYWAKPNLPGGRDGSLNFQPGGTSPVQWYQTYIRIDHAISSRHRIFGNYGLLDHFGLWSDSFKNVASGDRENFRRQTIGLDDVYTVSPNLVVNVRYGFARWGTQQGSKTGFDASVLSFPPDALRPLDLSAQLFPNFAVAGYAGLGGTYMFLHGLNSHSALGQLDYIRGNHSIKAGVDVRQYFYNRADLGPTNPSFSFSTGFTNGPLNTSPSAPVGQSLAAFLLGQPTGGSVSRVDSYAAQYPYYSFYLTDNWRVTSRLTVNLGVRYEYYGPETERYNRSVRGFAFDTPSPIEDVARAAYARSPVPGISVEQFRVRGGLLFAGVGGQPRELYQVPTLQFGPRFGFAYRMSQRTVLRGGYGIFYLPIQMPKPILSGFSRATSLVPTLDNGVTFVADLNNPFPGGLLEPLRTGGGLATDMGQSVSFFRTDGLRGPYLQRWSLTLQRMLPFETLIEASYVGTRATKLLSSRNVNVLPESFLSTLSYRDESRIAYLSQSFPNPFRGLLPGSSLNGATISRAQLLLPFPHFTGTTTQVNQGYSWYHGLEARVEKRLSEGLSYILSYTWSKSMAATDFLNSSDRVPYESVSSLDRTQALNLTVIWDLPFGRDRKFGRTRMPLLSQVVDGWTLSTIWQAMSGTPLTFPDSFFSGDIKGVGLEKSARTVDRWFNVDAGFVRDPRQQPSYHLRTFPLRLNGVRTDGINYWDISVLKDIFNVEKIRLEFRADFFNAFNHPNFGAVNTSPSSGSFGKVTSDMTLPRRIQFGLKVVF